MKYNKKGIIGITLAAIMIASIFAMVAPTTVAKGNPPAEPTPGEIINSIRIYGDVQPAGNAPERYDSWTDPFDPTVIPKDSVTFNPAYFDVDWPDAGCSHVIRVNDGNAREKTFLRAWYEPCGKYWGPRKNHTYETINLEYTYLLMDTNLMPTHGAAEHTQFAFPIAEISTQTGLGAFEQAWGGPAPCNVTRLEYVNGSVPTAYNKTTNGTIELEVMYREVASWETVQFLDHKLQFMTWDTNTTPNAIVKISYAGNYEDDAARGWILLRPNQKVYFDRHNNMYDTPNHVLTPLNPIRTWYVQYEGKAGNNAKFTLGKELRRCDVFYVNAGRYDVTAIEVLDTTGDTWADEFKYITLRTKLPKGTGFVQDESVVSTQEIATISPVEIIPMLPPFNMKHDIIDDIDIPLWKTANKEKYWTMQNGTWWNATIANQLDTDSDGIWIAYDASERVIEDVNKTEIYYIYETVEQRYSTNLLEKLNEVKGTADCPVYENWTKFDIQSLPDQYTEFVLPEIPDYYELSLPGYGKWPVNLSGDYLITTSFIAPQANGTIEGWNRNFTRVAFSYDTAKGMDGIDIYVNYNYTNKNNTVRIYGDTPNAPDNYTHWEQPFNPTVIRKDSITFDAAILRFSPEYSMSAQNENCDLKTYLRVWYEPQYPFFGHHCGGDPEPAVVTETTYMLIESQDKKPFHGEINTTWFAFPIVANSSDDKAKGLEFFENEGTNSSMTNLVRVTNVTNITALDAPLNKTTDGLIRIEKTYILSPGETVQFIDFALTYEASPREVKICYKGNKDNTAPQCMSITLPTTIAFIDRNFNDHSTSKHTSMTLRTWYARFDAELVDGRAMITVGKELQRDDIFYVDGVRYEIPALEVLDWNGNLTDGAEKFKFITLRTPFPKYLGGDESKEDDCYDEGSHGTSSQYIWKLHECNTTPVLPPFNMDHEIVDDTDVVLWQPLKLLHKWPYGDKDSNRPGGEYFPCAERYLTMQYPPYAWLKYFRAVPIDTDSDMSPKMPTDWQLWENYPGPFYPGNVTEVMPNGWQCCKCGIPMPLPDDFKTFDNEHWIANDVDERIIDTDPLDFCWKSEDVEPRYSTNLLEILNETLYDTKEAEEDWTKFDIQTMPEDYTAFKLPVIPSLNLEVYVGGEYQETFKPDKRKYPGSYLITTSFIAPNAKGDLNLNQSYTETDRFGFTYNVSDCTGIYINENVTVPIKPEGERFDIALSKGDNYVSLPVMPDIKDPAAIFGPEVEVWEYNPAGLGNWTSTTAVANGTGYYVYAPKPKTVPVYGTGVSLPTWSDIETANPWTSGWNLIGPGNTSIDVPSDVLIMTYVKGVPAGFVPHPPGQKLEPGKGYWAYK